MDFLRSIENVKIKELTQKVPFDLSSFEIVNTNSLPKGGKRESSTTDALFKINKITSLQLL